MNRKRKTTESFKRYRENLKFEKAALKRKLRGIIIWPGEYGSFRYKS